MGIDKSFYESPIIIFGTGQNAVKFLYQNRELNVLYFLDNNGDAMTMKNLDVFRPSADKVRNGAKIIIATSEKVYPEIAKQLRGFELEELEDFIYYDWFDKKIALLHGNCHMSVISSFLLSSNKFTEVYAIYPNPTVVANTEGKVNEKALKACDLFIHQQIRSDNKFNYFFSDEYVIPKLSEQTIKIIIPNLFRLGTFYFPQTQPYRNDKNAPICNGRDVNGMFPHGDRILDKAFLEGGNWNEIINFVNGEGVFSEEEIISNFNVYINKIREREVSWEIKILDYILTYYKEKKLFYDEGHPSVELLKEIAMRLLKYIGISEDDITTECSMDTHEVPIYPMVKKVLDLKWKDDYIRKSKSGKKLEKYMDFEKYVKGYLWWIHDFEEGVSDEIE